MPVGPRLSTASKVAAAVIELEPYLADAPAYELQQAPDTKKLCSIPGQIDLEVTLQFSPMLRVPPDVVALLANGLEQG
jgi:hypothetical protein